MELDSLKDWIQIAQGLATMAAILIAGIWAYYVFAVGRSATAQVQITCHLKEVSSLPDHKILGISVVLTNTGRTRVDGLSCEITAAPVSNSADDRASLVFMELLPERLLNEGELGADFAWGKMFTATVALEPNEVVAEDILLSVRSPASANGPGAFAAEVTCDGNVFGGRIILRRDRLRKSWSMAEALASRLTPRPSASQGVRARTRTNQKCSLRSRTDGGWHRRVRSATQPEEPHFRDRGGARAISRHRRANSRRDPRGRARASPRHW